MVSVNVQSPPPAKNPRVIETGHPARSSTAGQTAAAAPPVISLVTEHGLSLLNLMFSIGYDWSARMLLRRGADIKLQVRLTERIKLENAHVHNLQVQFTGSTKLEDAHVHNRRAEQNR